MKSAIYYILAVTYGGKPVVTTEPDVEATYDYLIKARRNCNQFHILNARRCVVLSSGNITFTEIRIDFDENGMTMYDKYGTLIDRYTVAEPEAPKKYVYRMRRWEHWQTFFNIAADSEDEAYAIAAECYDGEYEAIEGECTSSGTKIVSKEDEELKQRAQDPDWCHLFMAAAVGNANDTYAIMPDKDVPEIIRLVQESKAAQEVFELLTGATLEYTADLADDEAGIKKED